MHSENRRRFILFLCVAAFHGILLFAVVLRMDTVKREEEKRAEIMKLVDIEEEPPPPQAPPRAPPPPLAVPNATESIAENMIASDEAPDTPVVNPNALPPASDDTYLPAHKISAAPSFSEDEIRRATVYPPIALRSGIEGTVILELFVDSQGFVRDIKVLQEKPPGRGFGEAAVKAFTGKRGKPAQAKTENSAAESVPVAARYRYPVRFRIK
ncbi:MAG: energy transducer TonB [Treponema sp.]|jgi:protein TonB|nr:energy transducer TonB [Treponema sp.]